jgi:hypothetical protein
MIVPPNNQMVKSACHLDRDPTVSCTVAQLLYVVALVQGFRVGAGWLQFYCPYSTYEEYVQYRTAT